MTEMSLTVTPSPEIDALITKAKSIESKVSSNEKMITRKTDFLLCPVCQNGYLYPTEKGKIFGVISDKWLVCNKCYAEFDKKLSKALNWSRLPMTLTVFSKSMLIKPCLSKSGKKFPWAE